MENGRFIRPQIHRTLIALGKTFVAAVASPMRIIGGTAAGRTLKAPKGQDARPTLDLVRQALFNSLGDRVVGARVLELFGGTGALSLEAISRGAVHALCVELARGHARIIQDNFKDLGFEPGSFEVRIQDVFTALPQLATQGSQFDLILADPPYGEKNVGRRSTSLAQQLLDHPQLPSMLAPGGRFILGHTKRDTLTVPPPWKELKTLKHGDSWMRFFTVKVEEPPAPADPPPAPPEA
jgi:16S rRNA (guanine966-N2)-methyltransferase